MKKTKKDTIQQSNVCKGSPIKGGGVYGGKDLRKGTQSFDWKRVGVMDSESGDDETDEQLHNWVEKMRKRMIRIRLME